MRPILYSLIVLASLFAACHSREKTNTEKFREIDDSLRKTNPVIGSFPSDESLFTSVIELADSIKVELRTLDHVGDNNWISDSIIVNDPRGARLYQLMMAVYSIGAAKATSSNQRQQYQQSLAYGMQDWLHRYFHHIASVGAWTVLSKFENDAGQIKSL
jgi:hypothetical protein